MRLDTRWRITCAELAGLLASLSAFFGKMNAKRRGDDAPAEMQCGLGGLHCRFCKVRLQAGWQVATAEIAGLLAGFARWLGHLLFPFRAGCAQHRVGMRPNVSSKIYI